MHRTVYNKTPDSHVSQVAIIELLALRIESSANGGLASPGAVKRYCTTKRWMWDGFLKNFAMHHKSGVSLHPVDLVDHNF